MRDILARLHTSRRSLHAVVFEQLFPQHKQGFSTSLLRLQQQNKTITFHVEPQKPLFGPKSVLYFYADRTASSMEYSSEMAYELVRSSKMRMAVTSTPPLGALTGTSSTGSSSFETNRIYQPKLLEAKNLWLWDYVPSGASRTKCVTLSGVDTASGEPARLMVHLQGGSESGQAVDHHLELAVNGATVGETSFAGKRPHLLEVTLPTSLFGKVRKAFGHERGRHGVVSGVFLDRWISPPGLASSRRSVRCVGGERDVEVGRGTGPPIVVDVTGR
jgi:hypothetical protein